MKSLGPLLARLATFAACALSGLASPALAEDGRVRITNMVPFDVAVCHPNATATGFAPHPQLIKNAVTALQPHLLECLTPASTRGPAEQTEVALSLALDASGALWKAAGPNLLPPGAACIEATLGKRLPLVPLPVGEAPIALTTTVTHDATVHPTLVAGVNEPSDWVAAARGALPQWCECYAPFASTRPPVVSADVQLATGPAKVTLSASLSPEAMSLGQCLLPHLQSVPVQPSKNQFRFALRLVHLHSADGARAPDLVPETAFAQDDLVRNQRFAASQRQLIERTLSAREYDGLVTIYQKTKKADLVPTLDAKCKALVEADGRWLDAARTLLEQETRMEKTVTDLAAKDPSWQAAADAMVAARQVTAEEVGRAESTRESDRKACPKLSYK